MTPQFPPTLRATISLPASKSISNRVLVMNALGGGTCQLENLAECDDTRVLIAALRERPTTIDIGAAGTAMRFGTALFAATPGASHVMTGTARMQQRPIAVLVDALRELGADISYVGNEGFPPLKVNGKQLAGGSIALSGEVSSQYISALLMVGPTMEQGLQLQLTGHIISRPYIDMTLALMRQMGAKAAWADERTLRVEAGGYRLEPTFAVESDWSAASYWYEILALTPDADARIVLPYLHEESLQGDSRVQHFFKPLGVNTAFTPEGVVLTKAHYIYNACAREAANEVFQLDLLRQPDLAQTLVVACAMLRRPFRFTGLQSLRIKETDRIAALQNELAKFGLQLEAEGDEAVRMLTFPDPSSMPAAESIGIDTYHDHRMAMAFAPCALLHPGFKVNNPEVVTKSYPQYWQHLEALVHNC